MLFYLKKVNIITYFLLIVFVIYWFLTFLIVSPDNYIKINAIHGNFTLNGIFFQRWDFFAPPPQYNDRLYYKFRRKDDSTKYKIFEVMQPIQEIKSKKAPFNSSADILDYILSNSLHNLGHIMFDFNKEIDYQISLGELKDLSNKDRDELIKKEVEETGGYQTLKSYSYHVASFNNIDIKNYETQFIYAQSPIPRFSERRSIKSKDSLNQRALLISNFFTNK